MAKCSSRPLLIAGYYGFDNLGDEAILAAVLAGFSTRLPSARPVVLSGDPERTRQEHGVEAIDRNDLPAVAELAREAGLLVLGGGGLLQDYWPAPLSDSLTRGIGGLPFYFRFPLLASGTGCPLAVLAVGVGPLESVDGRRMTRAAFEVADSASVRDLASLELLRRLGLAGPEPLVAADPAVLLDPAPPEELTALLEELELAPGEPLLGVSVRHWERGVDPARWEWETALALDVHLHSHAGTAVFIPFQTGGSTAGENDLAVCNRLATQVPQPGRVRIVRRRLPPRLCLALLAHCRAVLAMRFHAALLALVAGVPTTALAYDPKVRSLFRDAGLDDLALQPTDWSSSAITSSLEKAALPALRARFQRVGEDWRCRAEAGLDLAARTWLAPGSRQQAPGVLAQIALAGGLARWDSGERPQIGVSAPRATPSPRAEAPAHEAVAGLEEAVIAFVNRHCTRAEPGVALVVSGTPFDESNGQRPAQLAQELRAHGFAVLFAYFRWPGESARALEPLGDGLLALPLDHLLAASDLIASCAAPARRLALVEFPYPPLFELVSKLRSGGWAIVYDAMDDWSAFHAVGEAGWFDAAFEEWLVGSSDAVVAVSPPLVARIRSESGRPVALIGNATSLGLTSAKEPKELPRGEITVGYFGYLSSAWFDWPLIVELAAQRPSWRFHLLGYGAPEGLDLPENVLLLGRQPRRDLSSFAALWDVAIVPFRPGKVAAAADPIKVYEYLSLGLPVVTCGAPPPPGTEEYVVAASGARDVLDAIPQSIGKGSPRDRQAVVSTMTWRDRAEALLAVADGAWRKIALRAESRSEGWR